MCSSLHFVVVVGDIDCAFRHQHSSPQAGSTMCHPLLRIRSANYTPTSYSMSKACCVNEVGVRSSEVK